MVSPGGVGSILPRPSAAGEEDRATVRAQSRSDHHQMKTLLLTMMLCSVAQSAPPGNPATRPTLVLGDVRMIWDAAPHNAFTDLTRFKNRWFCTFREASAHVSKDGAVRVLVSDDAHEWKS